MQASVEAEKVLNPYAHPHASFFKYLRSENNNIFYLNKEILQKYKINL